MDSIEDGGPPLRAVCAVDLKNQARSVMFEYILRSKMDHPGPVTVFSRAISSVAKKFGLKPTETTRKAMGRLDIDVSDYLSKKLEPSDIVEGTLFVCFEKNHANELRRRGAKRVEFFAVNGTFQQGEVEVFNVAKVIEGICEKLVLRFPAAPNEAVSVDPPKQSPSRSAESAPSKSVVLVSSFGFPHARIAEDCLQKLSGGTCTIRSIRLNKLVRKGNAKRRAETQRAERQDQLVLKVLKKTAGDCVIIQDYNPDDHWDILESCDIILLVGFIPSYFLDEIEEFDEKTRVWDCGVFQEDPHIEDEMSGAIGTFSVEAGRLLGMPRSASDRPPSPVSAPPLTIPQPMKEPQPPMKVLSEKTAPPPAQKAPKKKKEPEAPEPAPPPPALNFYPPVNVPAVDCMEGKLVSIPEQLMINLSGAWLTVPDRMTLPPPAEWGGDQPKVYKFKRIDRDEVIEQTVTILPCPQPELGVFDSKDCDEHGNPSYRGFLVKSPEDVDVVFTVEEAGKHVGDVERWIEYIPDAPELRVTAGRAMEALFLFRKRGYFPTCLRKTVKHNPVCPLVEVEDIPTWFGRRLRLTLPTLRDAEATDADWELVICPVTLPEKCKLDVAGETEKHIDLMEAGEYVIDCVVGMAGHLHSKRRIVSKVKELRPLSTSLVKGQLTVTTASPETDILYQVIPLQEDNAAHLKNDVLTLLTSGLSEGQIAERLRSWRYVPNSAGSVDLLKRYAATISYVAAQIVGMRPGYAIAKDEIRAEIFPDGVKVVKVRFHAALPSSLLRKFDLILKVFRHDSAGAVAILDRIISVERVQPKPSPGVCHVVSQEVSMLRSDLAALIYAKFYIRSKGGKKPPIHWEDIGSDANRIISCDLSLQRIEDVVDVYVLGPSTFNQKGHRVGLTRTFIGDCIKIYTQDCISARAATLEQEFRGLDSLISFLSQPVSGAKISDGVTQVSLCESNVNTIYNELFPRVVEATVAQYVRNRLSPDPRIAAKLLYLMSKLPRPKSATHLSLLEVFETPNAEVERLVKIVGSAAADMEDIFNWARKSLNHFKRWSLLLLLPLRRRLVGESDMVHYVDSRKMWGWGEKESDVANFLDLWPRILQCCRTNTWLLSVVQQSVPLRVLVHPKIIIAMPASFFLLLADRCQPLAQDSLYWTSGEFWRNLQAKCIALSDKPQQNALLEQISRSENPDIDQQVVAAGCSLLKLVLGAIRLPFDKDQISGLREIWSLVLSCSHRHNVPLDTEVLTTIGDVLRCWLELVLQLPLPTPQRVGKSPIGRELRRWNKLFAGFLDPFAKYHLPVGAVESPQASIFRESLMQPMFDVFYKRLDAFFDAGLLFEVCAQLGQMKFSHVKTTSTVIHEELVSQFQGYCVKKPTFLRGLFQLNQSHSMELFLQYVSGIVQQTFDAYPMPLNPDDPIPMEVLYGWAQEFVGERNFVWHAVVTNTALRNQEQFDSLEMVFAALQNALWDRKVTLKLAKLCCCEENSTKLCNLFVRHEIVHPVRELAEDILVFERSRILLHDALSCLRLTFGGDVAPRVNLNEELELAYQQTRSSDAYADTPFCELFSRSETRVPLLQPPCANVLLPIATKIIHTSELEFAFEILREKLLVLDDEGTTDTGKLIEAWEECHEHIVKIFKQIESGEMVVNDLFALFLLPAEMSRFAHNYGILSHLCQNRTFSMMAVIMSNRMISELNSSGRRVVKKVRWAVTEENNAHWKETLNTCALSFELGFAEQKVKEETVGTVYALKLADISDERIAESEKVHSLPEKVKKVVRVLVNASDILQFLRSASQPTVDHECGCEQEVCRHKRANYLSDFHRFYERALTLAQAPQKALLSVLANFRDTITPVLFHPAKDAMEFHAIERDFEEKKARCSHAKFIDAVTAFAEVAPDSFFSDGCATCFRSVETFDKLFYMARQGKEMDLVHQLESVYDEGVLWIDFAESTVKLHMTSSPGTEGEETMDYEKLRSFRDALALHEFAEGVATVAEKASLFLSLFGYVEQMVLVVADLKALGFPGLPRQCQQYPLRSPGVLERFSRKVKELDRDLQCWQSIVDDVRDFFPLLNFFTVRELVAIQNLLEAVWESAKDPSLPLPVSSDWTSQLDLLRKLHPKICLSNIVAAVQGAERKKGGCITSGKQVYPQLAPDALQKIMKAFFYNVPQSSPWIHSRMEIQRSEGVMAAEVPLDCCAYLLLGSFSLYSVYSDNREECRVTWDIDQWNAHRGRLYQMWVFLQPPCVEDDRYSIGPSNLFWHLAMDQEMAIEDLFHLALAIGEEHLTSEKLVTVLELRVAGRRRQMNNRLKEVSMDEVGVLAEKLRVLSAGTSPSSASTTIPSAFLPQILMIKVPSRKNPGTPVPHGKEKRPSSTERGFMVFDDDADAIEDEDEDTFGSEEVGASVRSLVFPKGKGSKLLEKSFLGFLECSTLLSCLSENPELQDDPRRSLPTSGNRRTLTVKPMSLVKSSHPASLMCMSLYLQACGRLPLAEEVLMCSNSTTSEEIEIFLRRCFTSGEMKRFDRLYCLCGIERLTYIVQSETNRLRRVLSNKFAEKKGSDLVFLAEDSRASHEGFLSMTLNPHLAPVKLCELDELRAALRASIERSNAFVSDRVTVVYSNRPGLGKSLQIRTSIQNNRIPLSRCRHLTLTEELDVAHCVRVLKELPVSPRVCRAYHIDITSTAVGEMEKFFFELLVLGQISCSSSSDVFHADPNDLVAVECLVEGKDCYPRRIPMLQVLHGISCHSPQRLLAECPDDCVNPHGLDNVALQSACRLLERIEIGKTFNLQMKDSSKKRVATFIYNPGEDTPLPGNVCLELLLRHYRNYDLPPLPAGNDGPCWEVLATFVKVLFRQIYAVEEEGNQFQYMLESGQKGLPESLRRAVLMFAVKCSQDFATPTLLGCTGGDDEEESATAGGDDAPGVLDVTQRDILRHYSAADRRKWGSKANPYIFVNGAQGISFIGLDIVGLDLVSTLDGSVVVPNAFSKTQEAAYMRFIIAQDQGLKVNYKKWRKTQHLPNPNDWPRKYSLSVLCRLMGYPDRLPFDPRREDDPLMESEEDSKYDLNYDNMRKLAAVALRIRCNIPVVLMGETGCGKSKLIQFLANLGLHDNLVKLHVHGGTTKDEIREKVIKARKIAESRFRDGIQVYVLLFFDEVNTCEHMGFIKKIVVDGMMDGQPAFSPGLKLGVICACNPYREHSEQMKEKYAQAGLGYRVQIQNASHFSAQSKSIPMRDLVYRVQPLPPAMMELVFDYGDLEKSVEDRYSASIIRDHLHSMNLNSEESAPLYQFLLKIVSFSQNYMRSERNECSFVSLRNVKFFMKIFSFFVDHPGIISKEPIPKEFPKELTRPMMLFFSNAVAVALATAYQFRLSDRNRFLDGVLEFFEGDFDLNPVGGTESTSAKKSMFNGLITRVSGPFVSDQYLSVNHAKNEALRENCMMICICTQLRIPLFLVGKPGSSKSLAKSYVYDSMCGRRSRDLLYRGLKAGQWFDFQCSDMSESKAIQKRFEDARQHQKERASGLDKIVAIVVLEEVGLAEDSEKMPLKCLHKELEMYEYGKGDGMEDPDTRKSQAVGFVGMSNWALDAAKMNRGLYVCRQAPSEEELRKTAVTITHDPEFGVARPALDQLIPLISASYFKVYHGLCANHSEFYGLRDFYKLLKYLKEVLDSGKPDKDTFTRFEVERCILLAFGGLSDDPSSVTKQDRINFDVKAKRFGLTTPFSPVFDQGSLLECFAEVLDKFPRKEEHVMPTKMDLVRHNLESNCRSLMLMTRDYMIQDLLHEQGLIKNRTVIFGSSFPKDFDKSVLVHNITLIKSCMAQGRTAVLLNMPQSLYEALYDMLNQSYTALSDVDKFVKLGINDDIIDARLHDDFKLILVVSADEAYDFPIPLLNRFDKVIFDVSDVLNSELRSVLTELEEWQKDLLGTRSRLLQRSAPRALCGFGKETLASMVLLADNLVRNASEDSEGVLWKSKELLLRICTPELLERSKLGEEELQKCRSIYDSQGHGSLPEYLSQQLHDPGREDSAFFSVVMTHSLPELEADMQQRILRSPLLTFKSQCVHVYNLGPFEQRQQFVSVLRRYFRNRLANPGYCASDDTDQVFLLQCDGRQGDLIACVKHIIKSEQEMMVQEIRRMEVEASRCERCARVEEEAPTSESVEPKDPEKMRRTAEDLKRRAAGLQCLLKKTHVVLLIHMARLSAQVAGADGETEHRFLRRLKPFTACREKGWDLILLDTLFPSLPPLSTLRNRTLVQLCKDNILDVKTLIHSGMIRGLSKVNFPNNSLDLKNQVLKMFESLDYDDSGVAVVDEEGGVVESKLGQLTAVTVSAPRARGLYTLLKEKIYFLMELWFKDAFETPEKWTRLVAKNNSAICGAGTFVCALHHFVEDCFASIGAVMIASMCTHGNLLLWNDLEKRVAWEALFVKHLKVPFSVKDISGCSTVDSLIISKAGTAPCNVQFPFSWLVMEAIDRVHRAGLEHVSTNDRQLLDVLQKSMLQKMPTVYPLICNSKGLQKSYLHDFICLRCPHGGTFFSLYRRVFIELLPKGNSRLPPAILPHTIHHVFTEQENRLSAFGAVLERLLHFVGQANLPKLLESCAEIFTSRLSGDPRSLDLAMMEMILDELAPVKLEDISKYLEKAVGLRSLLETLFNQYSVPVEDDVIHDAVSSLLPKYHGILLMMLYLEMVIVPFAKIVPDQKNHKTVRDCKTLLELFPRPFFTKKADVKKLALFLHKTVQMQLAEVCHPAGSQTTPVPFSCPTCLTSAANVDLLRGEYCSHVQCPTCWDKVNNFCSTCHADQFVSVKEQATRYFDIVKTAVCRSCSHPLLNARIGEPLVAGRGIGMAECDHVACSDCFSISTDACPRCRERCRPKPLPEMPMVAKLVEVGQCAERCFMEVLCTLCLVPSTGERCIELPDAECLQYIVDEFIFSPPGALFEKEKVFSQLGFGLSFSSRMCLLQRILSSSDDSRITSLQASLKGVLHSASQLSDPKWLYLSIAYEDHLLSTRAIEGITSDRCYRSLLENASEIVHQLQPGDVIRTQNIHQRFRFASQVGACRFAWSVLAYYLQDACCNCWCGNDEFSFSSPVQFSLANQLLKVLDDSSCGEICCHFIMTLIYRVWGTNSLAAVSHRLAALQRYTAQDRVAETSPAIVNWEAAWRQVERKPQLDAFVVSGLMKIEEDGPQDYSNCAKFISDLVFSDAVILRSQKDPQSLNIGLLACAAVSKVLLPAASSSNAVEEEEEEEEESATQESACVSESTLSPKKRKQIAKSLLEDADAPLRHSGAVIKELMKKIVSNSLQDPTESPFSFHVTDKTPPNVLSLIRLALHGAIAVISTTDPVLLPLTNLLLTATHSVPFLPTMAEDKERQVAMWLEESERDYSAQRGVGVWYRCPCGEPYYIGECKQPDAEVPCPNCKKPMGGENHRFSGEYLTDDGSMFKDKTLPGHILGNPEELKDFVSDRQLTPSALLLTRVVLHSVLAVGSVLRPKAVERLIDEQSMPPNLTEFFLRHLQVDITQLSFCLGCNEDDAVLFSHSLLQHILLFRPPGTRSKLSSPSWATREERNAWETEFDKLYLSPLLQNSTTVIERAHMSIIGYRKKQRHSQNSLIRQLDGTVVPCFLQSWHSLWAFRRFVTMSFFQTSFRHKLANDAAERRRLSLLRAVVELEPVLRLMRHLPNILKLQKALLNYCMRRIDYETASGFKSGTRTATTSVKKIIQAIEGVSTEEVTKTELYHHCQEFCDVWRELRDTMVQQSGVFRLPSKDRKGNPIKWAKLYLTPESPVVYFLPQTREEKGRLALLLTKTLMDAHNSMVTRMNEHRRDSTVGKFAINPFAAALEHLCFIRNESELLPLARANTRRALGEKLSSQLGSVEFNFESLQQQLADRFLTGKPLLNFQSYSNNRMMYSGEAQLRILLDQLNEQISPTVLDMELCGRILKDLGGPERITKLQRMLEVSLGFLVVSAADHNQLLLDYMKEIFGDSEHLDRNVLQSAAVGSVHIREVSSLFQLLDLAMAVQKVSAGVDPLPQLPMKFKPDRSLQVGDVDKALHTLETRIDVDFFIQFVWELIFQELIPFEGQEVLHKPSTPLLRNFICLEEIDVALIRDAPRVASLREELRTRGQDASQRVLDSLVIGDIVYVWEFMLKRSGFATLHKSGL